MGYEQVSDWSKHPQILDATKIDWASVRDGKTEVYLHDNPRRNLFKESVRYFSGGCVRLEDAWRLSKWLFHRDLTWEGRGTEEPVPLDQPVPVYITYMTAVPDGQSIAYFEDAYGRDKAKLAAASTGVETGR
jgi:murein L,D-transpeptidase YcbB/YkuD